MEKNKPECHECNKKFSNGSNLRAHVKKFHSEKLADLAPFQYKNPNIFNFPCHCGKNFNYERHLRHHKRKQHGLIQQRSLSSKKKCPLCSFHTFAKTEIKRHFQEVHRIVLNTRQLEFPSVEDFLIWKTIFEKETSSKYTSVTPTIHKTHSYNYYVCHRSGNYISKAKGLRNLRKQGSIKINSYCPASIKLINADGKCKVSFIETHVGHDSCIKNSTLTEQIAANAPFEEILHGVRDV